ncbi:MAG: sensor histidine kinase [Candidatus Promineifilaceae bacterium]
MSNLRSSLWLRLTLAFLFVALAGVILVAILANRATSAGFERYLQTSEIARVQALQQELADYYAQQGNWNGVAMLLRNSDAGPQGSGGGYFLRLLDSDGQMVASRGGQSRAADEFDLQLPVTVSGQTAGTLLATPAGRGERAGEQFLASVNQAILWSGLAAILVALFLALLLARRLTQPLSRLAAATRAVAAGDLSQQVPVSSDDELGQLASDFNRMAAALELSEKQRRQLLADTAHDLRTPISVIRSHLEAMLDGVFPLTEENLAVIHEETLHLGRLVEDVRVLSLAETGQLPLDKKALDLRALASQMVASFSPLAEADGVTLTAALKEVSPVFGDEARLHQVLANLLANALRYAPQGVESPPTVMVSLAQEGDKVQLAISDNGPGLTAEQRARVFDRFWRSDEARERQAGGSGLGLAISQSIVAAHQGSITVQSLPGEGTTFTITLPALPQ